MPYFGGRSRPSEARNPGKMAIPKFIYQTPKRKDALPPLLQQNIEHIRTINKGWSHRLFDDAEIEAFIEGTYGQDVLALYRRIEPLYGAARADLFRYLLIYETGGVYLDIKSSTERALNSVLRESDEFILSHWSDRPGHRHFGWGRHPELGPRGEYQNWHIIAAPKHPFLRSVIDRVLDNIRHYNPARSGVGKMAVLRVTGPIAYTQAIDATRLESAHRFVEAEALGLRYSVLETSTDPLAHELAFEKHYRGLGLPVCLPDFDLGSRSWTSVSRNEPCPCGSGLKYKQCHGKLG